MSQAHSTRIAAPPYADELHAYIREQTPAYVDFLCELVRTESPSEDPAAQRPVMDLLADPLHELGFETEHIPGTETGGMLHAQSMHRRNDQPRQLLLGHCDTVWPHGTLDTMPIHHTEDGTLRGPGVFDMKAGLASIVFALKALDALDLTPALPPDVLITSDEEIGSWESVDYIEQLARRVDRAFVLEPALDRDGKIKTARKGSGTYEIIATGKASHAGLAPEEGASAIRALAPIVEYLFALNDPERGITVNVGTIDGGTRSNVIAATCRITVDTRMLTQEDANTIDAKIKALEAPVPGVTLDVRGGIERPPMERTAGNKVLWTRAQQLGQHIGLALDHGRSGGASDGNITSQYTATLDGLGAVGDGAHADHEFIAVEDTVERCALLALLLMMPSVTP